MTELAALAVVAVGLSVLIGRRLRARRIEAFDLAELARIEDETRWTPDQQPRPATPNQQPAREDTQ